MLKLDRVSKTYKIGMFGGKELRAVNDVSFSIGEGEVVSLIGESGSGKSTIGKMILGLISVTSGSIEFNGADISILKKRSQLEYYRKVQGVFQDPFSSYNPIFKADKILWAIRDQFFPEVNDQQWNDRIKKSLNDVGLNPSQCLNKYPHQLSGGQLQRLLIARALLLDVQFLVADEIISMLDASTRIDVLNLLADLKLRGLSILFITHDLSLAYYISERSLILYRGSVVEMGDTQKIFSNPIHPYTRMLMTSVPRLDKKWEDVEIEIKVDQTDQLRGCAYYDRCPDAEKDASCAEKEPALIEVEENHFVACKHEAPLKNNKI
jgi:peptide/nickel transport system ATP-binding protein